MIKLANIIKEDSNISLIDRRINYLIQLGYKKYQLGVEKGYGVYFITLPTTALSSTEATHIMQGFDKRAMIGYYSNIFKSGLSIKTTIKVS